jgi:hypothetical protein
MVLGCLGVMVVVLVNECDDDDLGVRIKGGLCWCWEFGRVCACACDCGDA